MKEATLCLLLRPGFVLLGRKKTGFGKGHIVGIGGKLEKDESARQAAVREVMEEIAVTLDEDDLTLVATIDFRFPAKPSWNLAVDVFTSERWTGEPQNSAEIDPLWLPIEQLPLDDMWDDSKLWLPRILAGERLACRFVYGDDNATVVEAIVTEREYN